MTQKVNVTINGKELSVPAGTTIIKAADDAGIEIPRFCYHPGLSIAGVCRFCMVKIEGNPKLQIGCNTVVAEGMKIETQTAEVKDAHKWALEFHLINHPLDCPICDQAGECELQNFYMKVGKYESQMEENKVQKPKALDVGPTLVLDTERCILCSRCVRFEEEVTKTDGLAFFNRGDRTVISTNAGKKIDHNYSYNLADICPVGAFTAKDFRFKCRVWFLKETSTVCPGCSTGCNVTLFQNRNQREYYRLKPRENQEVNGHWMCDYGRTMYESLNATHRFATPMSHGKSLALAGAFALINQEFAALDLKKLSLILTPQQTVEEYRALFSYFKTRFGALPTSVFVWRDRDEDPNAFDGVLFRGDKHSNSKGLEAVLKENNVKADVYRPGKDKVSLQPFVFLVGPEVPSSYPHLNSDVEEILGASQKSIVLSPLNQEAYKKAWVYIPSKVFAEKSGTVVNFKGLEQKLSANKSVFPLVRGIDEIMASLIAEKDVTLSQSPYAQNEVTHGHY